MTGYFEAVPVPPDGYVPEEFISPPLEALSEAKAFALEQAVLLCKEIGYRGSRDPSQFAMAAGTVVAVAKEFEVYLLGKEED